MPTKKTASKSGKTSPVPKKAPAKKPLTRDKALSPDEYMKALKHPLKDVAIAVREIIRKSHPRLNERIKWAAPSYYTTVDLVTFNFRTEKNIHLVFHHKAITAIKSELLHGEYVDRRMMYFKSLDEVTKNKAELQRIMKQYVETAQ